MNPLKNTEQYPSSYSPIEKPVFIDSLEKLLEEKKYQTYKGIAYYMDIIELPQTLKLAGIARNHDWSFANIEEYHKKYSDEMSKKYLPYVEIAVTCNLRNSDAFDYIFGCIVNSFDEIPNELFTLDTGFKKFASITFRSENAKELLTSNNSGMFLAFDYLKEHWIPKNKEIMVELNDYLQFQKEYNNRTCNMSIFEVYKCNVKLEPEMSLFIPLKN